MLGYILQLHSLSDQTVNIVIDIPLHQPAIMAVSGAHQWKPLCPIITLENSLSKTERQKLMCSTFKLQPTAERTANKNKRMMCRGGEADVWLPKASVIHDASFSSPGC